MPPDPSASYSPLFTNLYVHRYLKLVADFLCARVVGAPPENIVVLVGPSHAGKSSAVKLLKRFLKDRYAAELAADPSFVPFASAELIWERKVGLSFKDLYTELLISCSEVVSPLRAVGALSRSDPTADVRRRLRCVLRTRRTKAVFLDEGQQLVAGTNAKTALENLRAVKNLAVLVRIPIFISTTYELLEYVIQSAEIEARLTIVHLPPYGCDPREDAYFKDAVKWAERKLQARYLNFSFGADRINTMRDLCGGRIGTLMRWLATAEGDAGTSNGSDLLRALEINQPPVGRAARFSADDLLGKTLLGAISSHGFSGMFCPRAFTLSKDLNE